MTEESTERGLTSGPIGAKLFAMAAPVFLGLIALVSVNVVDTYFVGQLGDAQLAAMGFAFPVIFLATALSNGLSSGIQSVISRSVGAGDSTATRRHAAHGFCVVLATGVVVGGLGLALMEPMFRLLGAGTDTLPHITEYMTVWFLAAPLFMLPLAVGSALMATGDAIRPMGMMIAGAVINGILDPILIFGYGPFDPLGIEGAALASVVARAVVLAALLLLLTRDPLLAPRTAEIRSGWRGSLRAIGAVAGPVALTALVYPSRLGVVTRLMTEYGTGAVAALAAGSRLDAVALIVPAAVGMGLAPIVGQNWGARLTGRVQRALFLSEVITFVWGIAVWVGLALTSTAVAASFVEGPGAVEALALYLLIIPAGYGAVGAVSLYQQTLNAMGKANVAAAITISGGVLVVGCAAGASATGGLMTFLVAIVAADIATILVAGFVVRRLIRA